MPPAEPDKIGLHILLKLSALVIILAGIHAAADIIVQLLLAVFLPSYSIRSSPGLFVGELNARLPSQLWSL